MSNAKSKFKQSRLIFKIRPRLKVKNKFKRNRKIIRWSSAGFKKLKMRIRSTNRRQHQDMEPLYQTSLKTNQGLNFNLK